MLKSLTCGKNKNKNEKRRGVFMRGLVDLKNASLCVQQDSSCSSEAVELIQSLTLVVDAALTSDGYQSEYNPTFYNPSLF